MWKYQGVWYTRNWGEDTNQLVVELAADIGVEVKLDDISVSHRLPGGPRRDSSRPKPIIVKFVRNEDYEGKEESEGEWEKKEGIHRGGSNILKRKNGKGTESGQKYQEGVDHGW